MGTRRRPTPSIVAQLLTPKCGLGWDVRELLADDMENTVRKAYGELPNSAYMIQKGGGVFYKEAWARPDEWGPHLEKLLAGHE